MDELLDKQVKDWVKSIEPGRVIYCNGKPIKFVDQKYSDDYAVVSVSNKLDDNVVRYQKPIKISALEKLIAVFRKLW